MSKHTKGNWRIVEGNTFCAIRVDERVIADMRFVGLHYNKADAELIAAAPDLLVALQYAIKQVPELATVPGIAAVIAKATGEQA